MQANLIEGELNIIGDIAGEYEALDKLVKKMPRADWVVGVGDLIDRGPQVKQVVQRFMDEPNWTSVRGNHEDFLLSHYYKWDRYTFDIWSQQGGIETLDSYAGEEGALNSFFKRWAEGETSLSIQEYIEATVDTDHVEWIRDLPMFLEGDNVLITHAPVRRDFEGSLDSLEDLINSVLWNRGKPVKFNSGKFQVFGHNHNYDDSHRGKTKEEMKTHKWSSAPKTWSHEGENYAVCIDTDRANVLTGIHWPTQKIYQQDY